MGLPWSLEAGLFGVCCRVVIRVVRGLLGLFWVIGVVVDYREGGGGLG